MQKVVVLTGAGISSESGLKTFRDNDGLWEQYDLSEVATPEAWARNRQLVLEFYNMRRKQVIEAMPNDAHRALARLEEKYDVHIVTQNIDDLHERAGSTKVLHLHGEIRKVESIANPSLVYELDGWELKEGDTAEDGEQLRPHVVWFGEMVPNMGIAQPIVQAADIVLVVGTSLNVYPAAGLVLSAPAHSRKFLVDPQDVPINKDIHNLTYLRETAGVAVPRIVDELLA